MWILSNGRLVFESLTGEIGRKKNRKKKKRKKNNKQQTTRKRQNVPTWSGFGKFVNGSSTLVSLAKSVKCDDAHSNWKCGKHPSSCLVACVL